MAAGIGFVRDAQIIAKKNRDNLKNKSNFRRTYKNEFGKQNLIFKEATPEQLESFRNEFIKKQRRENIRTTVQAIFLTFIVSGLIIWAILA